MREIKFRAWDSKKQCMDYGSNSLIFDYYDMVEPACIMQYTGLKDCKGTEIYEGDIVQVESFYETHCAKVMWGPVNNMYTWMNGETWLLHFASGAEGPAYPYCQESKGRNVSIVGNIYENPELLEVEHGAKSAEI